MELFCNFNSSRLYPSKDNDTGQEEEREFSIQIVTDYDKVLKTESPVKAIFPLLNPHHVTRL